MSSDSGTSGTAAILSSCGGINYCVASQGYGKTMFGSGTKLIVNPERDETLKPSVYILPPPEASNATEVSAVCLVTDFFPNNLTVSLAAGKNEQKRTPEDAMVSIEDKSYSLVGYLTGPKSELEEGFQCNTTDSSTESVKTMKDIGGSDMPCIKVDEDAKGDEHMNLLSLTVFGLRIFFFKSIVFNILMTVRVWIS